MTKQQITIWRRFDKKKNKFKHNHIENGWIEGETPMPIRPELTLQKDWINHKWEKFYGFLTDDFNVIMMIHYMEGPRVTNEEQISEAVLEIINKTIFIASEFETFNYNIIFKDNKSYVVYAKGKFDSYDALIWVNHVEKTKKEGKQS